MWLAKGDVEWAHVKQVEIGQNNTRMRHKNMVGKLAESKNIFEILRCDITMKIQRKLIVRNRW